MKLYRLAAAFAAAALLCACGPQGIASAGSKAPAPAAVTKAIDKAALESTRGLVLAELAYEGVATAALKLIQTRVIEGAAAQRVRDANALCTKALIRAKGATTTAQRLAEVEKLRGSITAFRNLLPGEAPDEVR
jgi:hypothetical protein